jgi:hygromycin-B 4-O-kinase
MHALVPIKKLKGLQQSITDLIDYCPEERKLVHADFGFNNGLAEHGVITGVIDWGNSLYGDHLYDIGFLDLFSSDIDYKKAYQDFYSKGDLPVHFAERVECYRLLLAHDCLHFFSYSRKSEMIDFILKQIAV